MVITREQGCCGALNHHMGDHDPAMRLARANIAAWTREIEGEGLDGIVINTSGCGTTVKDYGFMFREEPAMRGARRRSSALAMDISEALQKFAYAPSRAEPGLTVAYHSACSLQHGQQITAAAEAAAGQGRLRGEGAGRGASLLRQRRHLQPAAAGDRRRSCGSASWTISAAPGPT